MTGVPKLGPMQMGLGPIQMHGNLTASVSQSSLGLQGTIGTAVFCPLMGSGVWSQNEAANCAVIIDTWPQLYHGTLRAGNPLCPLTSQAFLPLFLHCTSTSGKQPPSHLVMSTLPLALRGIICPGFQSCSSDPCSHSIHTERALGPKEVPSKKYLWDRDAVMDVFPPFSHRCPLTHCQRIRQQPLPLTVET